MISVFSRLPFIYIYIYMYIYFKADLVYTATTDSFTCGQFTMKITKRDQGELDITEATLIMSKLNQKFLLSERISRDCYCRHLQTPSKH
jgi:hypothetical protein